MKKINKNFEKGIIKTIPKKWTEDEIKKLLDLKKKNKNFKYIANVLGRSEVSVSIKYKRLQKNNNKYNLKHVNKKNSLTEKFIKIINPKNVLDVYAGEKSFYQDKIKDLTCNDLYVGKHNYKLDSLKLLCNLYYNNKKYDLIDLDPFGSAYDCFDLSIKMAKKGLIITFGEIGHKRFKRLDYVRTHYGIKNIEEFKLKNIIKEVQNIGLKNKKILEPVLIGEFNNISRVYFIIKIHKVTEQWEKNPNKSLEEYK